MKLLLVGQGLLVEGGAGDRPPFKKCTGNFLLEGAAEVANREVLDLKWAKAHKH